MLKEFLLYIYNGESGKSMLTPDEHLRFVQQCEQYIDQLKARQQLIAAQPLEKQGYIITKNEQGWEQAPIDTQGTCQVGYYHILAADIDEAIAIARQNPEFSFVPSASIEVRPVKTQEEVTGFVYPTGKNK